MNGGLKKKRKNFLWHHLLGAGLVFTLVLWLIALMTTQILRKLWWVRRGWINTHHPPRSALTVAPIELCLCRYVRVRAQPLAIPRHVCQQAFCLTTCWTASSGWLSSLHFIPPLEKKKLPQYKHDPLSLHFPIISTFPSAWSARGLFIRQCRSCGQDQRQT